MESEKNKLEYKVTAFSEYPGPRYKEQGDDSGEEFYNSVLKGLFDKTLAISMETGKNYVLEINLDDTAGYASSFLDEAFGNLSYDFTADTVLKHLRLISKQEPDWIKIIQEETIPEWHKKKLNGTPRRPTLIS